MAKKNRLPKLTGQRVLYRLNDAEREEYKRRHNLLLLKQAEFQAASVFVDEFQNALIEEHGLPVVFDLNLETGNVTERPKEDEHAQNGRV